MTDKVKQEREKFLEEVRKLGFPANIQGRKALEQRQQDKGGDSWAPKPSEDSALQQKLLDISNLLRQQSPLEKSPAEWTKFLEAWLEESDESSKV